MLNTNKHIKSANIQDVLKFIAMISMLIDHSSAFVLNIGWLRVAGRFAFPIFCFFAGYNYYSKKIKGIKYFFEIKRFRVMMFCGIIIHIIQVSLLKFHLFNMFISIPFGFLLLDIIINNKIANRVALPFLALFSLSTFWIFDYGTVTTMFLLLGYTAYKNQDNEYKILLVLSLAWLEFFIFFVMQISGLKLFISALILAGVYFALTGLDFKKEVNSRIFLISRYLVEFYVIHFTGLIILCYYLNFF